MTPTEARHFLHSCNDEIEAGPTPDLIARIRAARAIVAAAERRQLARKPQDFDVSPLPLFGDAHKQLDLFGK